MLPAGKNNSVLSGRSLKLRLSPGETYASYDEIIKCVERWIFSKSPEIPGCDILEVRSRLIQRIIELSSKEYIDQKVSTIEKKNLADASKFLVVNGNGIQVSCFDGTVTISMVRWIYQTIKFFSVWIRLLTLLVAAVLQRCPKKSNAATILMEGSYSFEDRDESFTQFCRRGPIEILFSTKRLIVCASRISKSNSNDTVSYAIDPLAYHISKNLSRKHRFSLLLQHLTVPLVFFRSVASSYLNVLISTEIAYVPIVRWLDQKLLIEAVVITTSHFLSQALWMRALTNKRFSLHMIWYSQNIVPKVYRADTVRSDLPQLRHIRADTHWVWTPGFRDYLIQRVLRSEVKVVGPILWYLQDSVMQTNIPSAQIVLFDIIPIFEEKNPLGAVRNYYTLATIKSFVVDTLEICDELSLHTGRSIEVVVKQKRKLLKGGPQDTRYLSFLKDLVATRNNFNVISEDINLFKLLAKCEVSLSVPYTSTAYVSAALGRPAIYYDPTRELTPQYELNEFVQFASGREELKKQLELLLKVNITKKLSNIPAHV